MPSASIAKFNAHPHAPRRRRRPPIVNEMRHALTQLELQGRHPSRESFPASNTLCRLGEQFDSAPLLTSMLQPVSSPRITAIA